MPSSMPENETDQADRQKPFILRLLPLFLIVAAAVAIWFSGVADLVSLQKLAEHRESLQDFVSANSVLAVCVYIVLYAVIVALSLPVAAPLTLAGGFLFGGLAGGFLTVFAATIGAMIIFLLARGALAAPLSRMAGPWLGKLRDGFHENALSYLLFLRLVPAFPFWVVNLAPALLGVNPGIFALATFIGIIPGTFAFAFVGQGLDSLLVAPQQAYERCLELKGPADNCHFDLDPSSLLTKELVIAFAALGVVALIPVIAKKIWRKEPGKA